MPGFIRSNKVSSDRDSLLSQNTEGEGCKLDHGTSINAVSEAKTSILDPERAVIINDSGPLEKNKEYAVYLERWYVLAIFSSLTFLNCCAWNTWGPIEDTASVVLQWNPAQFALLANWGCITCITTAFFFSWFLHTKGLRVSVLVAGGLLVIGVGIRCIPVSISMMKWTIHIGHIFIGLAGPVVVGAATSLSATWFPSTERTTATAISSTSPYLGLAASFLIGPGIVGKINATTTPSPLTSPEGNFSYQYSDDDNQKYLHKIRLLMYVEFGATALIYVAALIHFPAKPATPPTASALAKREGVRSGLITIVRKFSFWSPAIAFALSGGVYGGWTAQIAAIFKDKADQTTCGWIGFYANLAALFGGQIIGRCADYFTGKMKPILLLLIVASCAALSWSILLANDFIPFNMASLYASVILFGLFLNSTTPIFFEISVEGAFPVGEETTTMMMVWVNNLFASFFLILPMVPSIGKNFGWLNWVMLGTVITSIPLLIFYKEHYNRLDYDSSRPTEDVNDRPDSETTEDVPS